jgi:8-oxo-dGTP pyrophosphatase MutT (NUDIX family)
MNRPPLYHASSLLIQGECIFAKVGLERGSQGTVCLKATEGSYDVSLEASECDYRLVASHELSCKLCRLQLAPTAKEVRLVTIAIVESADGFFLLCRNALRKTLYPRHWVVPGGHVEQAESLEEAVTRELLEETGIQAAEVQPICALQKSFISAEGQVLAHFLIVPYHVRIPANHSSVDLRIDPDELDTAVWLTAEMLRAIWRKEPGSRLAQTSAGDVVEFAYSQMHEIDPPGSGEGTADSAYEAFTALIGK